ncbi:MAG: AAA family ATPase [Candidatus Nitrosoglobus sp.]
MYKHYFGLKDHPFRLVPDPHYFFPASFHEVVSKCLLEGLVGTLPIAVLSGPAGVGKTLLLARLMVQLGKNYPIILISNPKLHLEELLASIQSEFNITAEGDSTAARLSALEHFGQHSSQIGKRPVILVDEADSTSEETLTALSKLASPIAAGIPPFFIVLATRNDTSRYLRLLPEHQSAVKAYSLLPLLTDQVGPYIDLRLCQAGYMGESPFNPEAITRLAEISHGIPRLINRLCDATLLEASLSNEKRISPLIIDEVAQGMWLSLGNESPSSNPPLAKGTEAAFFSPKLEQFPSHLESLTVTGKNHSLADSGREDIQTTVPLKEEEIYDLDNVPPMEQSPRLTSTTQNDKRSSTLLQRLRISEKKPWATIAMGIAVLVTGSFYIWGGIAPDKISPSSAAEFAEVLKNTTNTVKNLAMEKGKESAGMTKNDTSKAALSLKKASPETLMSHGSETNIYQEIKNTTKLREETNQSSQSPQITASPIQIEQQEQSTAISKVKSEENPNKISPNSEIAMLLRAAEQQKEQSTVVPNVKLEGNLNRISSNSKIAMLLAQAKQQIASLKLTTPESDNAYDSYTNILKIAPNHPDAVNGLQRIRDYYVNWGLKAESHREWDLAATYYKRALNIFPDDSAIRTALHRVQIQRENN